MTSIKLLLWLNVCLQSFVQAPRSKLPVLGQIVKAQVSVLLVANCCFQQQADEHRVSAATESAQLNMAPVRLVNMSL